MNERTPVFIDWSVDTGDIDDNLPDETIQPKIRDEYLHQSSVTFLLVGIETKKRKHIDWEIMSTPFSMILFLSKIKSLPLTFFKSEFIAMLFMFYLLFVP